MSWFLRISTLFLEPPLSQYVAVCCSATHCNTLRLLRISTFFWSLHCSSVLQCVAQQHTATHCDFWEFPPFLEPPLFQCVAVCCSATHCNTLRLVRISTFFWSLHFFYFCGSCAQTQRTRVLHPSYLHTIQLSLHKTRCNTLTATHCNTLQLTATHCSSLQHNTRCTSTLFNCLYIKLAATHCNTLQHTATHCNTLQHTAAHCNTTPAVPRCYSIVST